MRRHDVDAVRVIALSLLILYHILIGFQPWGIYIGFITNAQSLEPLWALMDLLNIWRIPILFVVSGMGVHFAMEQRDWKQLFKNRTVRILVPLVFGSFFVVPISSFLFSTYYYEPRSYIADPGHLWFLVNIFLYVLILLPIFALLKRNPANRLVALGCYVANKPFGILLLFSAPLISEVLFVNPTIYSLFAGTFHGFLTGLICFFSGFMFVSLKEHFWHAVDIAKPATLALGLLLFILRVLLEVDLGGAIENVLVSFESACWILAAFGFGSRYLNRPSKSLRYLSSAVYPVYIVHMPVQFFFASLIFPVGIPTLLKLMLLLFVTYVGSLLLFECIKRLKGVRILFGINTSGRFA